MRFSWYLLLEWIIVTMKAVEQVWQLPWCGCHPTMNEALWGWCRNTHSYSLPESLPELEHNWLSLCRVRAWSMSLRFGRKNLLKDVYSRPKLVYTEIINKRKGLLTLQTMFSTFRFLLMLMAMSMGHTAGKAGHWHGQGTVVPTAEAPEQLRVLPWEKSPLYQKNEALSYLGQMGDIFLILPAILLK